MTSFAAARQPGADAPLVDESALAVWGDGAIRRAAWARDVLQREAPGDVPYRRADVRYAVTRGPDELAAVWAATTVLVAPDESVLRVPTGWPAPEAYDAFLRGERTPSAPDAGVDDLAGRIAEEVLRAGADVLRPTPAELVAVGDGELRWTVRREDGDLVTYRIERGMHRELARSADPASALTALVAAIGG
ncbi:hypothetical protein [Microbacterium sp. NPDC055683]